MLATKKISRNQEFKNLFDRAHAAGMAAGHASCPPTMIVQQHAQVFNDNSPVIQQWAVPDGPCGFAWIVVKPGNSAFANWLKKNNLGRKDSYAGGVYVSVGEFRQSVTRKEDYAYAFANVLREAGIKAYANSRMD